MNGWGRLTGASLAPSVGPFPHRRFLELAAEHGASGDICIVGDGANSIALVVSNGVARFVGDHHLTDYHSPLGFDMEELVALLLADLGGVRYDLDSLPGEAAEPLLAAFEAAGRTVVQSADESCRVIELAGADPEGWESVLRSKDRHEVRRKRRRYESARGTPEFATGREHVGDFVELHRSSVGDKGDFMTDQMERFFGDLLRVPTARLDVLQRDGRIEAAAVGFEDDSGYYLYNSAYDINLADQSPGFILIDHLISRAVAGGKGRFDFLKGAEVYKRRLGAVERPLFRLQVAV
jgi:CelD/BcsL family acetyltransferase involved in cellulose biosynthesis